MTEPSPEKPLAPSLNPDNLLDGLHQPTPIPNIAAQALGGIGLGDVKAQGLKNKTPESPRSPESSYADIIEAIKKQADVSAAAYSSAMQASNTSGKIASHSEYSRTLEESISEWQENGTLSLIAKEKKENASLEYDLVTVPNFDMTDTSLSKIFNHFYTTQRLSGTASLPEKLLQGSYDLCGANNESGSPVRFALFPNKLEIYAPFTAGAMTSTSLKEHVDKIQAEKNAPLALPSLMEGMFWWYTKRQQLISATGDPNQKLNSTDFHETYLNHIIEDDLREKPLLMQSYVSLHPIVVDFNNIGYRLILGR